MLKEIIQKELERNGIKEYNLIDRYLPYAKFTEGYNISNDIAFVYDFMMVGTIDDASKLSNKIIRMQSDRAEQTVDYENCSTLDEVQGLIIAKSNLVSIHEGNLNFQFPETGKEMFSSVKSGYVRFILVKYKN